jgi:hypothetical protein
MNARPERIFRVPRFTIGRLMIVIAVIAGLFGVARYNLGLGCIIALQVFYVTMVTVFSSNNPETGENS